LQSFLLSNDSVDEDDGTKSSTIERDNQANIEYAKIFFVNVDTTRTWPYSTHSKPPKSKMQKIKVPFEVMVEIFSFLPVEKTKSILNSRLNSSVAYLNERRETICFHSKMTMEEDVLGYGITLQYNKHTGELQYANSPLDIISKSSFYSEKVRKGVWRESFTHFLPLYINKKHGSKSLIGFEFEIQKMFGRTNFSPLDSLNLISILMNTQVVNVMNGTVHASMRALEGYGYFHRLLIALCEKYPKLLQEINKRERKFFEIRIQ
jgi:hypothetical protein